MLDARRLRVLREIARRGSFTAAAEALSFTPSAVSQQMTVLEREARTRLFERGARGVRLTEAGVALAAHAEAILTRLDDAEAELHALAGRRAGRLRFGSFPTATGAFGAAASETFRRRYPEIELLYVDAEPYESLGRIAARELDLALTFAFDRWPPGMRYDGVLVSPDDDIEYIELFDDPFSLVLPVGHRLTSFDVVPITELAGERLLGGPPWGRDFRHLCEGAGFEPTFDASCRTADFLASQSFVATGRGVTLVAGLAHAWRRDDIVVRPLRPAPVRHVQLAVPRTAYRAPATQAMVEVILEHAQSGGRERPAPPPSSADYG